MNKAERKQHVTKIKKLLKQPDYAVIGTGIELARGLNEPAVFEALLGGWSINEEGALTFEEGFDGETLTKKWSDKTWPYFSYALMNLIGYAPHFDRANIKRLDLSNGPWPSPPAFLATFENLTDLSLLRCKSLGDLDGLASCAQLTSLDLSYCKSLRDVDVLAGCGQLTCLDLTQCNSLESVDGIADLERLSKLTLKSCGAIQVRSGEDGRQTTLITREEVAEYQRHIRLFLSLRERGSGCPDEFQGIKSLYMYAPPPLPHAQGLAACTQLNSLSISAANFQSAPEALRELPRLETLRLSHNEALQDISALAGCDGLVDLDLCGSKSLENIDSLGGLLELTFLDLSVCHSLTSIDVLASCKLLTELSLSRNKALQDISALAGLNLLTSLNLGNCPITSTRALADLKRLTTLSLNGCKALDDVSGLVELPELANLDLRWCDGLNPAPPRGHMTTREQVAEYQEIIKKSAI